MTATVEAAGNGGRGVPGHVLTFADAIYPAVERARGGAGGGPQAELIDAAVRENARMNAERIRDDRRFLALAKEGGSGVVGAYYNLHARRVSVLR